MISFVTTVCIDAPTDLVWAYLSDLQAIEDWSEAVLSAKLIGAVAKGVGAERVCALTGNLTIHERWLDWDEGRSFRYVGTGLPLIARATNRWSIQPAGPGQTLLTSEAAVELKGGVLGRALEPIVGIGMRRMGSGGLAGFKYFVEHGHPYRGRLADLPPAPAGC